MQGIAYSNGELELLTLPKASTALDGDSGLICLRALVTAVLCLFDVAATTAILAQVIPDNLIHYELDDQPLNVEGPLLSSLR